jgi:hypothetical protein
MPMSELLILEFLVPDCAGARSVDLGPAALAHEPTIGPRDLAAPDRRSTPLCRGDDQLLALKQIERIAAPRASGIDVGPSAGSWATRLRFGRTCGCGSRVPWRRWEAERQLGSVR